jgi:hypothetical protein
MSSSAAAALGRWVFLAPIGYLNSPRAMGKSLIHDSERAPSYDVRSRTTRQVKTRKNNC